MLVGDFRALNSNWSSGTLKILGGERLKGARSYDESLVESLKDPVEASAYLQATLEDGEPKVLYPGRKNGSDMIGDTRYASAFWA